LESQERNITSNRKGSFEYFYLQEYEAGLQLMGSEVKSIRAGKINLTDAYCFFNKDELYIKNMHIATYDEASYLNHEPRRDRKLLLNRSELDKLIKGTKDVGMTIIPTKVYITEKGKIKVGIALAKGKKMYDKRESIKEKETKRALNRSDVQD
jgi:SsrA-binding protein